MVIGSFLDVEKERVALKMDIVHIVTSMYVRDFGNFPDFAEGEEYSFKLDKEEHINTFYGSFMANTIVVSVDGNLFFNTDGSEISWDEVLTEDLRKFSKIVYDKW
jgi:hypothetical protein